MRFIYEVEQITVSIFSAVANNTVGNKPLHVNARTIQTELARTCYSNSLYESAVFPGSLNMGSAFGNLHCTPAI